MNSYSGPLIIQLTNWIVGLLENGINPSNTFSGITSSNKQFFCHPTELGIDRKNKLDFMKEVINAESCVAFCHSATFVTENNIPEIMVFSGQANEYWASQIKVANEEPIIEYFGPDASPGHFMQNLFAESKASKYERATYLALWNSIRDNLLWKDISNIH